MPPAADHGESHQAIVFETPVTAGLMTLLFPTTPSRQVSQPTLVLPAVRYVPKLGKFGGQLIALLIEVTGAEQDIARSGVILPGESRKTIPWNRKTIPWKRLGARFAESMPEGGRCAAFGGEGAPATPRR